MAKNEGVNDNQDPYARFRVGAGSRALEAYKVAKRRAEEANKRYLEAKGVTVLGEKHK